jgi:hypothetical protein
MAKTSFDINISPDMATRMTLAMIEQGFLKLRAEAIQRYIVYNAAKIMLEEVVSRIPTGADYAAYRSSLRLVQSGVVNPVFAVASEPTKAEEVDGARDVLYFKPKNARKPHPVVKLLMRYQPWTSDTLPFKPPTSIATTTKRKVSTREVEGVREKLQKSRPEWSKAFKDEGVKIDPSTKVKATTDLAYTALRLEYGLGGSRSVAHWRPAIVATKQRVAALFESEVVGRAMLDWDFDGWKSWRNLSAAVVPGTEIDSFEEFQDKIR